MSVEDASPDESDDASDRAETSRDGTLTETSTRAPFDSGAYWMPLAASCDAIAPPGAHLDAVVDVTLPAGSGGANYCTVGEGRRRIIHQVTGYYADATDFAPGPAVDLLSGPSGSRFIWRFAF